VHKREKSTQRLYTKKMNVYILKLSKLALTIMPEVSSRMGNSSILSAPGQLPDRALELIGSKADGLLQSELRRLLGVESSKCSKIVSKLMRSGLIKRDSVSTSGYRTYLLRLTSPRPRDAPIVHHIDTYLTEIYLLYLMRGSMN
jgi:hypothetical protein